MAMTKNGLEFKLNSLWNKRQQETQAATKALAALNAAKSPTTSTTDGTTTTYPSWEWFTKTVSSTGAPSTTSFPILGGAGSSATITGPISIGGGWSYGAGGGAPAYPYPSFPSTSTWFSSSMPETYPDDDRISPETMEEMVNEVVADQIARHN